MVELQDNTGGGSTSYSESDINQLQSRVNSAVDRNNSLEAQIRDLRELKGQLSETQRIKMTELNSSLGTLGNLNNQLETQATGLVGLIEGLRASIQRIQQLLAQVVEAINDPGN